jgi:hypothetical protein
LERHAKLKNGSFTSAGQPATNLTSMPENFKKIFQETIFQFLLCSAFLVAAVGLQLLVRWMEGMQFDAWLISFGRYLEVVAALTDGIVFLVICVKIIIASVRELGS